MAKNSILMLSSSSGQLNVITPAFKAAGWYGYASGFHTVAWKMTNFIGRVYIQVSLATEPKETDWSNIFLTETVPFVVYPANPALPTGLNGGDTGNDSFNWQANIVWCRLKIDRSYLTNPVLANVGTIDNVFLNY